MELASSIDIASATRHVGRHKPTLSAICTSNHAQAQSVWQASPITERRACRRSQPVSRSIKRCPANAEILCLILFHTAFIPLS